MESVSIDTARQHMHSISSNHFKRAKSLLEESWPNPDDRPSERWLREQQAKRTIPLIKIGCFVHFDPAAVQGSLTRKFTVEALGEKHG